MRTIYTFWAKCIHGTRQVCTRDDMKTGMNFSRLFKYLTSGADSSDFVFQQLVQEYLHHVGIREWHEIGLRIWSFLYRPSCTQMLCAL